ncbi:hypothetical protein ACFLFF_09615 [Brevibacillus reuszeri]|uniref:hypothetical protein n=1 Tax=Brevibacillus reuszeri TaxID=54915 RepID=UPI00366A6917
MSSLNGSTLTERYYDMCRRAENGSITSQVNRVMMDALLVGAITEEQAREISIVHKQIGLSGAFERFVVLLEQVVVSERHSGTEGGLYASGN